MNNILNGYTQEQIEELAIKQIESNDLESNIKLKIVSIDKEYKKHNKEAVKKAIVNGSIILLLTGIILNSNSASLSSFGTEDLIQLFNDFSNIFSYLPVNDLCIAIYSKVLGGINYIIDKLGIMGIIIAMKSIKFVLNSIKDTKETLRMKKEIMELKELLKEKGEIKNER